MKTKKIALVSASALTAGLAHGQVLYTYYNHTVYPGISFSFDVNQDGYADFTEEFDNSNASKPYISDSPGLNAPSTTSFVLAGANADGSDYGLPLTPIGTLIDGTYENVDENGYFYQDGNSNGIGSWESNGTNVTGYVGLELQDNSGNPYYGWARFIYTTATNATTGVSGALTLVDCAMEAQPNVGIYAGQTAPPGTAPFIVIPPSSVTNGVQTTVQLSVIATGNPAPTYQWMAGAVGSGIYTNLTNGGIISGATNSVLTISDVTLGNDADYVVVLSNSIGSTVNPVPATVTVAPLSISGVTPSPVEVYTGAKVSFNVSYSSSVPILSFQWMKDGVKLANSFNISGATSSNLVISSMSPLDSGNYSVVLVNSFGPEPSPVDPVTVQAPVVPYEQVMAALGPVAYYTFNETNDPASNNVVAFDHAGGFNGAYGNATQNGNANYDILGPDPADGFLGFSVTNTAVDIVSSVVTPASFVSIPPLNLNTNTVTFTAWLNPQTTEPDWAVIMSFRSAVSGTANGPNYTSDGNLGYHWNDNGNTYNWDSGLLPPVGQWSFVALTIAPTQAIVYLFNANGMATATNVFAHIVQPLNTPGYIGGDQHDPNFVGDIDEVSVFNQTLSQAQLTQLYNVAVTGTNAVPTPITLNIQTSGANVILTWPQGTLWQSPSVAGPWTSTAASTPYITPASGPQMFYRVQ